MTGRPVVREGGAPSRTAVGLCALAIPLAVATTLIGLAATGNLSAAPAGLNDPGALVRIGLPVVRSIHDCVAALTVGLLVLAAFVIPPAPDTDRRLLAGTRLRAVRWAAISGSVWFTAGALVLVFTYADVAALPLTTPGFGTQVTQFIQEFDLGRSLAISVLVVLLVTSGALMATRVSTVIWSAGGALLALLPLALAGHASGSNDHQNAVDSLGFHLVGVTVWVGGLTAVILLSAQLGPSLPTVVHRYSTMAGWCFGIVAISGLVNAWLRVGSPTNLLTAYGTLILIKTGALVLLGTAGWWHRRHTLGQLDHDPANRKPFLRLAIAEVLVMGTTIGVAVALSRSAPPVPQQIINNPVSALLGYPEPPQVTFARMFSQFFIDGLWLAVAVILGAWYLIAVRRLRRRGDHWPVWQSITWIAGCIVLVYVTSGGPAVYGRISFSAHMAQHMTLTMVAPPLLALSAPFTLALRTTRLRPDGSSGPRELLLAVLHSRVLRVVANPLVASALFVGSLVVFYYTPLFDEALFTHTGHVLMCVHFLVVGYLFSWVMIGTDPAPVRTSYPLRLMLLLATLSFHAFFGVALISSTSVLAAEWWHALGMTNTQALLADQHTGGAIAWGTGDLPSLAFALILAVMWSRDDAREGRRKDRQADRDGNAELNAYNDYLEKLETEGQAGPTRH